MKPLIISLFSFLSYCGFSQNVISLALTNRLDSSNHSYGYRQESPRSLETIELGKAIIPKGIGKYQLKVIRFQPEQFYNSAYKRGMIDLKYLRKKVSEISIDSTNSCSFTYLNNFYYLVGWDKENKMFIIADENHDFDFTNDRKITENEISPEMIRILGEHYKHYSVKAPICVDGAFTEIELLLYPIFEKKGETSSDRADQLAFYSVAAKEGTINTGDSRIKITVEPQYLRVFRKNNLKIRFSIGEEPFPTSNSNYAYNEIGDTVKIGRSIYRIDSINLTGSSIKLIQLAESTTFFGYNVGDNGHRFFSKDFLTNEPLSSSNIQSSGKYTLLDFWGTWCHPCIDALPALSAIHEKYKNNKIEFISVGVETNVDTSLLLKIINDYHLTWHHIVFDRKKNFAASLAGLYRVYSFPTTIIISPQGEIVLRVSGNDQMQLIDDKLADLFGIK